MSGTTNGTQIHKLDFDQRRPLLHDRPERSPGPTSLDTSRSGSFFEQVVEGIQERDRNKMKTEVVRYGSFACATLMCLCCGSITAFSLYAPLFMSRLHYSQSAVNIISIAAEFAMYLPVVGFGYLCDRYGPRPPAAMAGTFFGAGYLMAAFAYRSGPPRALGGEGWPFWTMVVAFIFIGMGSSCMYLSAVTTCAKNFGRRKNKGVALAVPIAAFGLSGMWVSQVGAHLLVERRPDGTKGQVDVFRFFLFLGLLLLGMGALGGLALKVVDEEEMIEDAIEELEQSGLLEEDEFFREAAHHHGYGTMRPNDLSNSTVNFLQAEADAIKQRQAEEQARKDWLLNEETRRFLSDHTMWWLAAGFFLVTGPGEAFINNLGTVIGTLYPSNVDPSFIQTSPATHVSIVAITSTLARLFTGTVTDLLAPVTESHRHGPNSLASSLASLQEPKRFQVSRVFFLIAFAILNSVGQVLLASGLIQEHAERFWIVSALVGAGYGAVFSLVPIIVSVVWGVENFGTNWGIVATVPAAGAAVWGVIYSAGYSAASKNGSYLAPGQGFEGQALLCHGIRCYAPTFWAMAVSVWIACGLWLWAWRGPGGWKRRGINV
ncbi:MFS monocarboxylic acid transporter [Venturia nashicola]|uniref:Probable transporter MCH1 n=1 Tax=Venturia nashicola TaxID=86259 RepID=A0A4Z1P9Z2_9PEZI|nr:MFS monocarboxylic acid transporter [Venturia nashicola]